MIGYISFRQARETQAEQLIAAVPRLSEAAGAATLHGRRTRSGPVFLAMGASLAAAGPATWLLRTRGVDAWRVSAGDTPLPLPASGREVIAVSQSGRSSETITAFESVDAELRTAVVNAEASPLAAAASHVLSLGVVPDSYASTVGYTLTVMALGMVAEAWDGAAPDPTWAGFGELVSAAERLDVAEAAALFRGAAWADFAGSGASIGSAEAGALLLRETARVSSSALSTRQYLHGAMESAGGGVHVLFGESREIELAAMLVEAGHRVLVITSAKDQVRGAVTVTIPQASLIQRPILEAIVLQSLAAQVCDDRKVDIEEFVFAHDDTKVTT